MIANLSFKEEKIYPDFQNNLILWFQVYIYLFFYLLQ